MMRVRTVCDSEQHSALPLVTVPAHVAEALCNRMPGQSRESCKQEQEQGQEPEQAAVIV
eukprot:COSAG06_NODE_6134_length_3091_cov_392.779937_1_plen_59_part_00